MTKLERLKKLVTDPRNYKKLNTLFLIRNALLKCIYCNYTFAENFSIDIPLTPAGKKVYKYLKKKFNTDNDNPILFAIFLDFYYDDLYIDIKKIDPQALIIQISKWIVGGDIRFPWIYDRHLYDKYFEEFANTSDHLDSDNTQKLLESTFKGVFQLGNLIIGPFGVLESKSERYIYPTLDIHLWHCPDPSCPSFHITSLSNLEEHDIDYLLDNIHEFNLNKEILDLVSILKFPSIYGYYDASSLEGTYELLVNAFGTEEHKLILKRIIDKEKIRELMPQKLRRGNSVDLTKDLNKAECFQLILLVEDLIIFKTIEDLIEEKQILIPRTEIRESFIKQEFGYYNTFLQCNQLGIRVSADIDLSLIKLQKLLKDIHNESPLREQLEWKLRKYTSAYALDQKLNQYVLQEDPKKIIRENILNGPNQLVKAFSLLPSSFDTINTQLEDEVIIEKILWKLGFDINLYPNYLEKFWKNLNLFKSDVLSTSKYNEEDKATIRSSAVNVFVSLEEILEQSLSFITWVLLSDHYLDTKFKYVYEDAREFMVNQLNGYEFTKGEKLIFDLNGKNTLFPLVQGFNALLSICDSLVNESPSNYKRVKEEFPSFYQEDSLRIFPFEHKKFVLDIFPSDYEMLKGILEMIAPEFSKSDVLSIRNRLQHKRDDFPTQTEILEAINSIDRCISLIENESIYPDVHLFVSSKSDEFNRVTITLSNYKGKEISCNPSIEFHAQHLPNLHKPNIIMKNIKLGLTNHPILFEYKEKSKYQLYWKNFPRKKSKT